MGAIVGGLYASGLSTDELEQVITSIDWDSAFDDDPKREVRPMRRKRDDDIYLVEHKPGFNDGKLEFPAGLLQGQTIDLIFKKITLPVAHIHNFDNLRIPYRAVAADLETGEAVVLGSGNLAKAMRASMSIPAIFSPTVIDGKLLVDGGIANNLPISIAREMGADVIIAVDISTPLLDRDKIKNVFSIAEQITGLMTQGNTKKQLSTLTDKDILIQPDLGNITTSDFKRANEAVPTGIDAANKMQKELTRLSLSEAQYRQYLLEQGEQKRSPPIIGFIRIENDSNLSDDVLAARINIQTGKPLDITQLEKDIDQIYALDIFQNVTYIIEEEQGQTGVVIDAKAKSWGPNYLQFGAAISGNMQGENSFNVGVAYTRTAINKLGGEWRSAIQLGEDPLLITEIYQPLDVGSKYFFTAKALLERRNINVFADGDQVAEFRATRGGASIAAGRTLGTWGDIRVGLRRTTGDLEVRVGDPSNPEFDFETGEGFILFEVDTFDNANFPHYGTHASLEWIASRDSLGADTDFDQILASYTYAKSFGRNTLLGGATYQTTLDDDAPIQSLFRAGGFFNLSGFQQNELSGQHYGRLALAYFRRINDFELLPTYLGASLEYGNVWQDEEDIDLDNALAAGSIFLGVDTVVGPIYFAYGHAEGGEDSLYFFLGRLF